MQTCSALIVEQCRVRNPLLIVVTSQAQVAGVEDSTVTQALPECYSLGVKLIGIWVLTKFQVDFCNFIVVIAHSYLILTLLIDL